MPDALATALSQAVATPGLGWLVAATVVAGLVRGFSGFGTAMVYLPVAALFVDPVTALISLTMMDLLGPIPMLPRAWREADRGDLGRLLLGAAVMLPVGLWLLLSVDPGVFRYAVSGLSLAMVACLLLGLRYAGRLSGAAVTGIGGAGGFLGGLAGLPGPPVILAYISGDRPPSAIRANTMLYLYGFEYLLLGTMFFYGVLATAPVVLGLLLAVPYAAGNMAGAALFRPGAERTYRAVAYAIIAASAIVGLPLWEG